MPLIEQRLQKDADGAQFINKQIEDVWLYYASILNDCQVT